MATESLMLAEQSEADLATALFRIASDPRLVHALHQILGGFCHQSRNCLNSLKLSLYLASRDRKDAADAGWAEVASRYEQVEQLFDRLQTICRPMPLTPVRASLGLLMEDRRLAWCTAMSAYDRLLELVPPDNPAIGDFDPIRLSDGFDAFVSSRAECGAPGCPARLSWRADRSSFHVDWEEPGSSGQFTSAEPRGRPDPLALPLLARVISSHGGSLELDLRYGLRLSVRWPLDIRS